MIDLLSLGAEPLLDHLPRDVALPVQELLRQEHVQTSLVLSKRVPGNSIQSD